MKHLFMSILKTFGQDLVYVLLNVVTNDKECSPDFGKKCTLSSIRLKGKSVKGHVYQADFGTSC